MNVNAMHRTPDTSPGRSSAPSSAPAPTALLVLAMKAGFAAAIVAGVAAGRVPEPVIILGVILVASSIAWHRTPPIPNRVRSHHRFTVVSRCGDGFVTIDHSGARRVARRMVLGSPTS
jgi:hypothetical protein